MITCAAIGSPSASASTASTDGLVAKFRGCAAPVIGTSIIDRVVDLCLNDRAQTSARDLIRTIY